MKKLKLVILPLIFVGILCVNISFLNKTVSGQKIDLPNLSALSIANAEIPPNTYYCFFSCQGGVGFIRICYTCNIMPFVWPAGWDGMCYGG
jgi:hypothetical protein